MSSVSQGVKYCVSMVVVLNLCCWVSIWVGLGLVVGGVLNVRFSSMVLVNQDSS